MYSTFAATVVALQLVLQLVLLRALELAVRVTLIAINYAYKTP